MTFQYFFTQKSLTFQYNFRLNFMTFQIFNISTIVLHFYACLPGIMLECAKYYGGINAGVRKVSNPKTTGNAQSTAVAQPGSKRRKVTLVLRSRKIACRWALAANCPQQTAALGGQSPCAQRAHQNVRQIYQAKPFCSSWQT